jgi:hypothetical protein
MPRCGRPARRAVSRRARADEKNPALSVDRKLLGTSTIGSHPARSAPAVAPHDPPRSAVASRSAIGRPIFFGDTLARQGNTLSAPQGNALWATGDLSGTIVYRNTVAASQYGALLTRARNFLFGNRSHVELGNLVQSNRVGVRAVGNSRGSQACGTKWSYNRIRLQRVNARQIEVQPRVR